ncbi:GNAT family N-acetyltransferase [Microbacterium gorillae]|uniref:GNAT family N-acetyltransferase n=1 Tax=Microbacterium gorillae TaxID=1231063 RepID=UPI0005904000|nr:GNAT family N-acetyltransferase [Microbacterium gorillae]
MPHPVLSTDRLTLTLPAPDDVDAITAACQDTEIRTWTPLPFPYRTEHAEHFVAEAAERSDADTGFEWAIRHEDELVGMISLSRRAPGAAEIGYWTAPDARGRGYLTEAAEAVVDFGFEPTGLGLDRLEWNAAVGNVPSARVARKLGFRFEGVRRGAFVTSGGRLDAWSAGRLFTDSPKPVRWDVLG